MKTRGADALTKKKEKRKRKVVLHPLVVTNEKRNSLANGNVFKLPLLCLIKKAHTFFSFFEHIKN